MTLHHLGRPPIAVSSRSHRRWGFGALLVAVGVVAVAIPTVAAEADSGTSPSTALYVNATIGSDAGTGSTESPLKTIQDALNHASSGTTIYLAPGAYDENLVTRVSGTASEPITIQGPAPAQGTATVFGTTHVIDIANSYYVLRGFDVDGQQAVEQQTPISQWPTDLADVDAFKDSVQSSVHNDRLIYIDGGSGPAVTGTTIDNLRLTGAGGECLRVRDDTTGTVISDSTIQWCGMYGVQNAGVFTYHNGEGVYIGTSPKSTTLSNYSDDETADTTVSGDVITTFGSECFDVKEHSHDNTLTGTTCGDNTEPTADYGSNVELRGYDNVVTGSAIHDSAGFGVKIDSDTTADPDGGNSVTFNQLSGQAGSAFYNKPDAADGLVCGNQISANDTDSTSALTASCPPPPSTPTPSPTSTPTVTATPSPSPTPTETATPSPSPTESPTPTPSPSPTASQPSSPTTSSGPIVSMRKVVRRTHRARVTFRWFAPPRSSATTFDLRWRDGRRVRKLGSWRHPRAEQRSLVTKFPLRLKRQVTYCVEVRAQDQAGHRSAWTAARCVVRLR
jgi:Protein of unknown function (DUF1565)